jgi:hypothetical protein
MQNLVFVDAKVQALIHENYTENNVIIYTDGSVVQRAELVGFYSASEKMNGA